MVEMKTVVAVVEMKAGMAVVVGVTKTVDVVSRVELKVAAAAGMGATKTVAVAGRVESAVVSSFESKAAAVGIETTENAAVAEVLLNILRPHAGTNTGHEQYCVGERVAAG